MGYIQEIVSRLRLFSISYVQALKCPLVCARQSHHRHATIFPRDILRPLAQRAGGAEGMSFPVGTPRKLPSLGPHQGRSRVATIIATPTNP